jgi:hypothetical protein
MQISNLYRYTAVISICAGIDATLIAFFLALLQSSAAWGCQWTTVSDRPKALRKDLTEC